MNYFQLLDKLDGLYNRLAGQQLTANQIAAKINRAIPFDSCNVIAVSTININKSIDVSGQYDPDCDEEGETAIDIELIFPRRRRQHRYFTLSESDLSKQAWHYMAVDVCSVLGHEYIHMEQFRRREFRDGRYYRSNDKNSTIKENQEYFGIPDEVDAYAFTAAAAMAYGLWKSGKPVQYKKTSVYQIYSALFDKKSPVLVKLERTCKKYYKRLEQQYYVTYHRNSH